MITKLIKMGGAQTPQVPGNPILSLLLFREHESSSASVFPFYTPSFDLALVGLMVFACLAGVHIWLSIRTKTVFFAIVPKAAVRKCIPTPVCSDNAHHDFPSTHDSIMRTDKH